MIEIEKLKQRKEDMGWEGERERERGGGKGRDRYLADMRAASLQEECATTIIISLSRLTQLLRMNVRGMEI